FAGPSGQLNRSPPAPATAACGLSYLAKVVTTPAGVIVRIALFPLSPTRMLPAASTARPLGPLNRAALPVPSVLPKVPAKPASVVTTLAGVILRIELLKKSAT